MMEFKRYARPDSEYREEQSLYEFRIVYVYLGSLTEPVYS